MFQGVFYFIPESLKIVFFLFGYISNNNSFKKPLSPEDEKKYIELYNNGSEEAKNILVERNLRLVAHIIKKYSSTGIEHDDLISIGTIGLIKGIISYKSDKGTRLATFAARCIDNEILMYIRANKKSMNDLSLYEPVGIDKEGNEISFVDIMPDDSQSIFDRVESNIQTNKMYKKMKKILLGRERKILELRYGITNGIKKTQQEIGKMLGISRSYVSRIEKKALKKLSKEMKDENIF